MGVKKQKPVNNSVLASGFPKVVAHHRAWLDNRGFLDRPWFVLCSAPDPVIPKNLPSDTVYAYVKFAGRSAKRHGLPDGDLTLTTWWRPQRWEDIEVTNVLNVRHELTAKGRLKRALHLRNFRNCELLGSERDDYVLQTLGTRFRGTGEHLRPSSGITLIAFALAHGIEDMIIAGMSFEKTGHDYNDLNSGRKHVGEDKAALTAVAQAYPGVRTSEPGLAAATGIPLIG